MTGPRPARRRARRVALGPVVAAGVAGLLLFAIPWARAWAGGDEPSRSVGTRSDGRLENGKAMPPWGPGFRTYSLVGATAGRQYVHGDVRDALVASFASAEGREAGRVFVVAETGRRHGGRIRPHRTHRNGLSVDVLMPMRGDDGPAELATAAWNRWGYRHELDAEGRLGDATADFEALAAWLLDLEAEAGERGLRIERVIVAPEYVPRILATPSGARLGALGARLSRKPSWVRHDEHVHVDFGFEGVP